MNKIIYHEFYFLRVHHYESLKKPFGYLNDLTKCFILNIQVCNQFALLDLLYMRIPTQGTINAYNPLESGNHRCVAEKNQG